MKTKLFIPVLLLLFGFINSSNGQMLYSIQNPVIENQIDSIFKEMLTLAEKFDYDGLNKGVDDRYKAGFISNGKYYFDYASLIDFIKSRIQGVSEQSLEISDKKITILSDNIVLLTATGIAQIKLDDGNIINTDFYWSFVFEKIKSNWKVVHSHQSRGK